MARKQNKRGVGKIMLYIALIFVIIILILEKIINNPYKKIDEQNNQKTNTYTKKEYLLTANELKFYKLLKQITDKLNLNLFCQVAMYELINTKTYKDFNKIKSKSIDFVITEKNCKIKMCIELDDNTHKKDKRIERDNFVNKLFEETGIKLLRIEVKNFYNIQELEEKITNLTNDQ